MFLAEIIVGAIEDRRAQSEDGIEPIRGPAHATALGTSTHDRFAGRLCDATAYLHALSTKGGIAHPRRIGNEVIPFDFGYTA